MQFQKSADTKVLESLLKEAKVGDVVSYEAMSRALGRDVRQHAIGAMQSARRAMLAEGVVFGTQTNVGLVRLNDKEIVESTESDRRKMKRASNRSLRKLSVVKFEALTEDDKRKHTTMAAQMGAISMFASKSSTRKIEEKVTPKSETLAIGETLKMFT